MAKSALDKLKELSAKKLVPILECPEYYDLQGIYNCTPDRALEISDEQCYICWTKRY